MKDIYLHGIATHSESFDFESSLCTLSRILDSKEISSRRRLGLTHGKQGFNGLDYVSLCDYDKRSITSSSNDMYNGYYGYVMFGLSLMFPKDKIEVVIPKYIDRPFQGGKLNTFLMDRYGKSTKRRYSDYPDEVQTKDYVSLEHLIGVTFPICYIYCNLISKGYSKEDTMRIINKELQELNNLLQTKSYDVGIYEPNQMQNLQSEDDIKRVLKYYG